MGKHRVIPCTPPADPDALLVDDATAREHIDTLRDVTTEIARTVAGLDGRATPHDVQQKLAAVLAGAAPPSPDLKRDARRRDDLERALRSVDDLRRASAGRQRVDSAAARRDAGRRRRDALRPRRRRRAPPPRAEPSRRLQPPRRRRFSLSRMFGDAYRRGAGVR